MSENIKVSEVSDILRRQLEGIDCEMPKPMNCWSLTMVLKPL